MVVGEADRPSRGRYLPLPSLLTAGRNCPWGHARDAALPCSSGLGYVLNGWPRAETDKVVVSRVSPNVKNRCRRLCR